MALANMKYIPVYFSDPSIPREIRIYSIETGQNMQEVLKLQINDFVQSCIKLVSEIKEMKRKAELERIKQEEESKIVSENPIVVSGHEEDPIGNLQLAQVSQ